MPSDADARASLTDVFEQGRKTAWLIDLDDTLVRMPEMHLYGAEAILGELEQTYDSQVAEAIHARFNEIFSILLASHQSNALSGGGDADIERSHVVTQLDDRIRAAQHEIRARWNVMKRFSRELLLYIAAEDVGVTLPPRLIESCVEKYWLVFAQRPLFYPGAVEFMRELGRESYVYLMTGSDARFVMNDSGQFDYDPERSLRSKRRRLEAFSAAGLRYRAAFIGDPVDKPERQYFEDALARIQDDMGGGGTPKRVVVLGDSYEADLKTPLSCNLATNGLLYVDGQREVKWQSKGVVSFGSFDLLRQLLMQSERRGQSETPRPGPGGAPA